MLLRSGNKEYEITLKKWNVEQLNWEPDVFHDLETRFSWGEDVRPEDLIESTEFWESEVDKYNSGKESEFLGNPEEDPEGTEWLLEYECEGISNAYTEESDETFADFFGRTRIFSPEELREMSSKDIVEYEDSLDYRNPDVIEEIMRRAEEKEEGITKLYLSSFELDSESINLNTDEIFDRAVQLILKDGE